MELDGDAELRIKAPCSACEGRGTHYIRLSDEHLHCPQCEGSGVIGEWVLLSVFLAGLQQNNADLKKQVESLTATLAQADQWAADISKRMSSAEDRLTGTENHLYAIDG